MILRFIHFGILAGTTEFVRDSPSVICLRTDTSAKELSICLVINDKNETFYNFYFFPFIFLSVAQDQRKLSDKMAAKFAISGFARAQMA